MNNWTALKPRVFTSQDALPKRDFTGYGFEDLDFIVGEAGLEKYEISRQRKFSGKDDGCYLILEKTKEGHVLSTDPIGLCKLFVYQNGQNWAASNSFSGLMDRVNASGWKVTPNYAVLDAWTIPSNLFGGCFSSGTAVREITLLDPSRYIVVKAEGLHVEKRPPVHEATGRPEYSERIDHFLATWLGRILGLAQSDQVTLSTEITGGLDSRTVFAFLLHLRAQGALPSLDAVDVFCSKTATLDYAVAQSLSREFEFPLAGARVRRTRSLTAEERFVSWRDFSLGMFVTPYIPAALFEPNNVTLGGHGGERHRQLTRSRPMADVLYEYAHKFRRYGRFKDMMATQRASMASLDVETAAHPDFEAHRNLFRRFHHTHFAQYTMRAPPLMATSLERCFRALSDSQADQSFLFYDIMERLHPGLAGHPYDDPEKLPSDVQLSKTGPLFKGKIIAGEVFAIFDPIDPNELQKETEGPVDILVGIYKNARAHSLSEGLGGTVLVEADETISEIEASGKLPSRKAFHSIHAVLLTALIANGSVPTHARFLEQLKLNLKRIKDKFRSLVR